MVRYSEYSKMIATSCFLTALGCNVLGWGSVPDPAGSLQLSSDPIAGLRGPTSKEKGEIGERMRERTRKGMGLPRYAKSWIHPCLYRLPFVSRKVLWKITVDLLFIYTRLNNFQIAKQNQYCTKVE